MKQAMRRIATVMHRADTSASFAFKFWDGEVLRVGDGPRAVLNIKSPRAVKQLFAKGFHGFGEAYMSGDLEVEGDLQELLRLGLLIRFDESAASLVQQIRLLPLFLRTRNTSSRARSNIQHHYDRSDGFYRLFLDDTMTYSCAYFRREDDSLEQAQRNKHDHICRKLMLRPGDRLVDVGCGWGGMLLHAAREYGITGLGNTLSRNQYEHASRKISELSLDDRIGVSLLDYRELSGKFDKFVSIGMFEHVGKEFIPVFMSKVAMLLKKGGIGLLHTIAKDVESSTDSWTQQYIFPGGYIPTLTETIREMGRAGFTILDVEGLRMHYARTLDCWTANFEKNVTAVRKMFDDTFVRMWRLYLNASSAGFKYGTTRLYQILFTNGLNNKAPLSRNYMYTQ